MRSRARLTAWLGLLALTAQLLAGVVSNQHLVQRLSGAPSLLEICSSTGGFGINADRSGDDTTVSAVQHCPFCLVAQAPALSAGSAIQPQVQRDVTLAWTSRGQGIFPRAPDRRHARSRAPPIFA